MDTEISAETIACVFDFLAQHKPYYLVSRSRIEQLPESLKGYTSYVTPELLDALGMPIPKARGEVYFFTAEKMYFRGARMLKEREDLKDSEFSCVSGPAGLMFEKCLKLKPKVIHIDYGSENAVEIGEDQMSVLPKLPMLAMVAQLGTILVLEDKRKNAIELPLDDGDEKLYAVGFTGESESRETVKSCEPEFPGCHVAEDGLADVVGGILNSKLEGLVINPGRPDSVTLDRETLRLLDIGLKCLEGQKKSHLGWLKKLMGAR